MWGHEDPLLGGGQEKEGQIQRCSLETQQIWMQRRKERGGKSDMRMESWAGVGKKGLCRAQEGSAHCLRLCPPPTAPEWVLPASVCPRSGTIIYLGKEHSGASRRPEVQKGLP